MLGIARHDLVALDVLQVVHQDVLAQHVDQRLNIGRHLLVFLRFHQLAEVAVGESRHEKLHVELVPATIITINQSICNQAFVYHSAHASCSV